MDAASLWAGGAAGSSDQAGPRARGDHCISKGCIGKVSNSTWHGLHENAPMDLYFQPDWELQVGGIDCHFVRDNEVFRDTIWMQWLMEDNQRA